MMRAYAACQKIASCMHVYANSAVVVLQGLMQMSNTQADEFSDTTSITGLSVESSSCLVSNGMTVPTRLVFPRAGPGWEEMDYGRSRAVNAKKL